MEVGCYWAVPIFMMLTGATLMNYREKYDTATFFRKRFARTLIPFLAWSTIVLVWKNSTGQMSKGLDSLQSFAEAVLNYEMEAVYWYFPLLFSIYLLMPLFSALAEPKYRKTLWYAVAVMFLLQSVIPPLANLTGFDWNSTLGLSFNRSFIYVFLGYLLSTCQLKAPQRYMIYLAGIASALFRYGAVFYLSTRDGAKNSVFFGYGYFPAIPLACAVFVWVKQVDWERVLERLRIPVSALAKISACSLGIYLIHKIVMYYELELLSGFGITKTRMIWRFACIPMTYLVALAIVWLGKKIPVVKRLFP